MYVPDVNATSKAKGPIRVCKILFFYFIPVSIGNNLILNSQENFFWSYFKGKFYYSLKSWIMRMNLSKFH